ncbi:hypothetical protein GE09DRAFT_1212734 [Coniochaeta sp. 2T2.1]|nr:hypothetical protein GE09DRAFT_1212734 [Coniochaeta sp. 2T2.1]
MDSDSSKIRPLAEASKEKTDSPKQQPFPAPGHHRIPSGPFYSSRRRTPDDMDPFYPYNMDEEDYLKTRGKTYMCSCKNCCCGSTVDMVGDLCDRCTRCDTFLG